MRELHDSIGVFNEFASLLSIDFSFYNLWHIVFTLILRTSENAMIIYPFAPFSPLFEISQNNIEIHSYRYKDVIGII